MSDQPQLQAMMAELQRIMGEMKLEQAVLRWHQELLRLYLDEASVKGALTQN